MFVPPKRIVSAALAQDGFSLGSQFQAGIPVHPCVMLQ